MKKMQSLIIYALAIAVLVTSARIIILDVQASKLKDPANYNTCDEIPWPTNNFSE